MKRILCVIFLVCLSGCGLQIQIDRPGIAPPRPEIKYPEYEREYPTVNIEKYLRQRNWIGREGQGSCTHASLIMLMRHMGKTEAAEYWRQKYGDGETFDSLTAKLDSEGFRWAGTCREHDTNFLEWAIATRRAALVTCKGGAHAILLVHLDKNWAGIVDNNAPEKIIWVPRKQFLSEWGSSNSWGITLVYSPPPPRPCS